MQTTDVIHKLREKLGVEILKQLKTSNSAKIVIPKRSKDNTLFDEKKQHLVLRNKTFERSIKDVSNIRGFAQTLEIAKTILELKKENIVTTKRDLFYAVLPTGLFKSKIKRGKKEVTGQVETDRLIEDIEVTTDILREDLGLLAGYKGMITGDITFEFKEENEVKTIRLNDLPDPYLIRPNSNSINVKNVNANFVLVVEKEGEYTKLFNSKFHKKYNCILITGKGQADRGTRLIIKRLNEEFKLPVVVITDLDPWGWYIFSVLRSSSISLCYESERLACVNAKFLGMLPSDIHKYKLPEILDAEPRDLARAKSMLDYTWLHKDIPKSEIELFLKEKKKAELESFSFHGWRFIAETYIPNRLKEVGVA